MPRSSRVDQSSRHYTPASNVYLKTHKDTKHDLQGIGAQFTDATPDNDPSSCGQSSAEESALSMPAALAGRDIHTLSIYPWDNYLMWTHKQIWDGSGSEVGISQYL
jgi:hypothetical protein